MDKNIKSGITFGLIGGFLTFLFGGWSVAVLGGMLGLGLGLSLGSRFERRNPLQIARASFMPALVAAVILVGLSLVQNIFILPALGKARLFDNQVIIANTIGFLVVLLLTIITCAIHGLSERQEGIAKLVLLAIVIITFPFIDKATGLRWSAQVIFALIFVILGLGLNIVVGYAGLLDLGYAAFFAIGAYTTGILSSPQHGIYMNFWLVIWIAAGIAALWGLILGAPTLPLRGDYLAIVTLGFGEMIPVIFRNLTEVTIKEPFTCWILPGITNLFGAKSTLACITFFERQDLTAGEKGISPIGRPSLPFIGEFQSDNPIPWYFLIIVIILLSIFIIRRLRESRLGRAWMAIREDELAASQMGIDPVRTKLAAFAMGATFSGFAGAFYAAYIRGIFPSVFDFSASIIILVIVILGGLGNINGVIVGGLVIMTADRLFLPALKDFLASLLTNTILPSLAGNPVLQAAVKDNANPILYRFLLFGLTLVIMMAVRPEGLIPSAQRRMELHAAEEMAGPVIPEETAKPNAMTVAGKTKAAAKKR
ncbi:MAG: branched-chain amino acid ABC transporter permease [Chloroflexi bacterium]|nr:branched-chain amino acid ABC transporter permease [Chloroflexota bacterium]MBI3341330.1 branched-chain amino acid ABC transporter permease [Chloroflexota bacterium]